MHVWNLLLIGSGRRQSLRAFAAYSLGYLAACSSGFPRFRHEQWLFQWFLRQNSHGKPLKPRRYCFRDSKSAEKIWQRSRKDAAKMPIFYIQVFGHRPSRKASYRRLNACGRGRRWGKATGRIIRTVSKPTNFFLSRQQKQKKVKKQIKRVEYNKKEKKREKCNRQLLY